MGGFEGSDSIVIVTVIVIVLAAVGVGTAAVYVLAGSLFETPMMMMRLRKMTFIQK